MNLRHPGFVLLLAGLCAAAAFGAGLAPAADVATAQSAAPISVDIDAAAADTPFPHFWEQMFGSGRAILALRASYRRDLHLMRRVTDFRYVRFHGILNDEVGLYRVGKHGAISYNFSYVDQIYDGLLAAGVRPFVELSFMPRKLARDPKRLFDFWYKPNISPPRAYAEWDALVTALARHLVARYGIAEVSRWYFEVWNEPNIGFWGGKPKQATYFTLYDHTARALKAVDARLRVGGPATAQAAWVDDFLAHCHRRGVPVDFVSTHVYANDSPQNVFKTTAPIGRQHMVCRAVRKVHEQIRRSATPWMPLIFSEYNASYANEPDVTDTTYMGPWLASTIRQCDGMVKAMSYWSFSDVFEEGGVVRTPFYGGFGAIAERGIPKPVYDAFALLHRLGTRRLVSPQKSTLVTRRADGTLVVALWNYAPPDGTGAHYTPPSVERPMKAFVLHVRNLRRGARAWLWRVDPQHGNVVSAFDAMGRPAFPTRRQIAALRRAAILPRPRLLEGADAQWRIEVPAHGLALVEIHGLPGLPGLSDRRDDSAGRRAIAASRSTPTNLEGESP